MPVLLTTPWNPGDADPAKTYPRAQISALTIKPKEGAIHIVVEFGNVVDNEWVRGDASPQKAYLVSGTDYDTMIAETTEEGDAGVIYTAAKRVAYEWLIANNHLAGTIE